MSSRSGTEDDRHGPTTGSSTTIPPDTLAQSGIRKPENVGNDDDSCSEGDLGNQESAEESQEKDHAADQPSSPSEPSFVLAEVPQRAPHWWLVICFIIPFAILGVLIRLGLSYIETFTGQPVIPLAAAQFVGCLCMGVFSTKKTWIEQTGFYFNDMSAKKSTLPPTTPTTPRNIHIFWRWFGICLYVGLASGLCGSITTFSSWALGMFTELVNLNEVQGRSVGRDILSALSELILTLALANSGIILGDHFAQLFPSPQVHCSEEPTKPSGALARVPLQQQHHQQQQQQQQAHVQQEPQRQQILAQEPRVIWPIYLGMMLLGPGLWIAVTATAFTMDTTDAWRHVVFSTMFAPFGAILRWYLSRFNPRVKHFPLGTFLANIFGSMVLAMIICLQYLPLAVEDKLTCQILSGLQDGFCGCLTTISTFIMELRILPRRATYTYGFISIVTAVLSMIVILGTFSWVSPYGQTVKCQV